MLITPGYELPQRESFKITYTLMEGIKQQTESRKERCTDVQPVPAATGGRKRVLLTSRVGRRREMGTGFQRIQEAHKEKGMLDQSWQRRQWSFFLKLQILFDNYSPPNFW